MANAASRLNVLLLLLAIVVALVIVVIWPVSTNRNTTIPDRIRIHAAVRNYKKDHRTWPTSMNQILKYLSPGERERLRAWQLQGVALPKDGYATYMLRDGEHSYALKVAP